MTPLRQRVRSGDRVRRGLKNIMAFDQPTRNRLQRFVNDAQREFARILRDTLAHYRAGGDMDTRQGLDRIVREQAFTVLNRLAALRMAEARGLLVESVANGFQAKGFQLYARLAGTGLGETGDAYRTYLYSVFDELSQDLPGLFDRFSPQGRLFLRKAALLQVLKLINHAEIEPLWQEDETIGWIYQYFNSNEERKAMRDASQAPRNSRELAVRNQFFTPRYVVEFLVDNTLGRLWFNATEGVTDLRVRCQYLLVTQTEQAHAAIKLREAFSMVAPTQSHCQQLTRARSTEESRLNHHRIFSACRNYTLSKSIGLGTTGGQR